MDYNKEIDDMVNDLTRKVESGSVLVNLEEVKRSINEIDKAYTISKREDIIQRIIGEGKNNSNESGEG